MDQIYKIRDTVLEYLSPRSSRRRALGQPSTPSGKSTSVSRPLPQAPLTEPKTRRSQVVIKSRISKKYLSPSDTKRSSRRSPRPREIVTEDAYEAESEDDEHDQLDLDVSEASNDVHPKDSSSQQRAQSSETDVSGEFEIVDVEGSVEAEEDEEEVVEDEVENEDEDEVDADRNLRPDEESELSPEAKVKFFLDRQTEIVKKQEDLDRLRKEDWHEDEAALFHKLAMRGYEPLLPSHWANDLRTTPGQLFTRKPSETFINSRDGNDFRAVTALVSLTTLGARVRGLLDCNKPQEQLIKKELDNYVKWSERDGKYHNKRFIPRLCIVAGHPDQEISAITKTMKDQLNFLAIQHRQALALPPPGRLNEQGQVEVFIRPPPVLFGVIIAHYITLFVTLDSSKVDPKIRTIAHFDFSNKDMDVWNGFAIAILVVTVRNKIVQDFDLLESETEAQETDPDA